MLHAFLSYKFKNYRQLLVASCRPKHNTLQRTRVQAGSCPHQQRATTGHLYPDVLNRPPFLTGAAQVVRLAKYESAHLKQQALLRVHQFCLWLADAKQPSIKLIDIVKKPAKSSLRALITQGQCVHLPPHIWYGLYCIKANISRLLYAYAGGQPLCTRYLRFAAPLSPWNGANNLPSLQLCIVLQQAASTLVGLIDRMRRRRLVGRELLCQHISSRITNTGRTGQQLWVLTSSARQHQRCSIGMATSLAPSCA